jgi:glycosyltransferase involved in cell wall biosynthesis
MFNEKVAAIIPAYNEAERIGKVLKVLTKTRILNEVIVVDDGSTDSTREVVSKFLKVNYIKNKKNMGKAAAMDRGVKATQAQIIFFCDADVKGLTPKIVTEIISPVLRQEVDMFIGVRNSIFEKYGYFRKLSGERAIRREVWEKLPRYYKHRFRVETGLNYIVQHTGRGFEYKIFNYNQPIKLFKFKKQYIYSWLRDLLTVHPSVYASILRWNFYDKFRI